MNKDFLSKPISLKGINLKKISLKDLKRNKGIIVGILFIIYVIVVLLIGKNLITTRKEVVEEYSRKEARVNSLKGSRSEEEIQRQIDEVLNEKEKLNDVFYAITPAEFSDILNAFKNGAPITWDSDNMEVSIVENNTEYKDYDIYNVYVKSFSGSFGQVCNFLDYVSNYDKLVRVDAINFRREEITGKMIGTLKLSFYFKK